MFIHIIYGINDLGDDIIKKEDLPESLFDTPHRVERVVALNSGYFLFYMEALNLITDGLDLWPITSKGNIAGILKLGNLAYAVFYEASELKIIETVSEKTIARFSNVENFRVLNNCYINIKLTNSEANIWSIKSRRFLNNYWHWQFDEANSREFIDHDLFIYYDAQKDERYIINPDGDIKYQCHDFIPHFRKGYLILTSEVHDEIDIIHDFLGKRDVASAITKQGIILARPLLYGDSIIAIVAGHILILNYDLQIIHDIPYPFTGSIANMALKGDTLDITIDNSLTILDHVKLPSLPRAEELTTHPLKSHNVIYDNKQLILKKGILYTK